MLIFTYAIHNINKIIKFQSIFSGKSEQKHATRTKEKDWVKHVIVFWFMLDLIFLEYIVSFLE